MSEASFDVLVLGAGPGGYVAAIRAAQEGKKVAVVEAKETGGVCLTVGCIPSKALIYASRLYEKLEWMHTIGIQTGPKSVEMPKMIAWKDGIVKKLTTGISGLFKNHKIELIRGVGKVTGRGEVEVRDAAGAVRKVKAANVIIATGSTPIEIPGFAFDEENVLSSTGGLALQSVPKRMVVIGGGYIGLELGGVYSRLGTQVTVVEATPGLLPGNDPDLIQVVARKLAKQKVEVLLETKAKGYTKTADGLACVVLTKEGREKMIPCDKILVTVGRRPNSRGLGLEELGIRPNEKGFFDVDPQRRVLDPKTGAGLPWLWAIGDVAGQPMLAHKASHEGIVAAEAIAGKKVAFDPRAVPAVIFTDPEISSVGYTEEQARAKGFDPVVGKFPFGASGRAMALGETEGFAKIVADKKTDVVLGVHIVGPEASELAGESILALEMGATTEDLARTIHAHPTLPETIMEAAEAVHGRAVHIFQK
ncbi:MAG: dihydrolipoyl dehydrogenase [Planctomycetes bacterium]|nr:dihydrolipoyl dehydrogenase [Planctomycetota bacterium]